MIEPQASDHDDPAQTCARNIDWEVFLATHDYRYAIDPSKIERELGWKAQESFESGLKKTVSWYLTNEMWWLPLRLKTYAGERLGLLRKSAAE